MNVAVIESCGANFKSVLNALDRLNLNYKLTIDKTIIQQADVVLLPGVGSAGFAMNKLNNNGLTDVICQLKQPVLGICLGMQLLYEYSVEDNVPCLGIIPGRLNKFPDNMNLIIPHMGWNNLIFDVNHPLFADIKLNNDVYFVHSYYAPINEYTLASCNYGVDFTAIVNYANFYGMQFHPEKSSEVGAKLLANFFRLVK